MTSKKSRIITLVFIPLAVVCIASKNSFSQEPNGKRIQIAAFGIKMPPGNHATFRQMLDDPMLTCTEAGCEVTEFMISFKPNGMDYRGPFGIKGNKLQGQALDFVRRLSQNDTISSMVFLENIKIHKKDKDENAGAIIFKADNK